MPILIDEHEVSDIWKDDEGFISGSEYRNFLPSHYPRFFILLVFLRHMEASTRFFYNFNLYHTGERTSRLKKKDVYQIEQAVMEQGGFSTYEASFLWMDSSEGKDYWRDLNESFETLLRRLICQHQH